MPHPHLGRYSHGIDDLQRWNHSVDDDNDHTNRQQPTTAMPKTPLMTPLARLTRLLRPTLNDDRRMSIRLTPPDWLRRR